jgi:hypothetical protein
LVRTIAGIALIALAVPCRADRLINIPVGKKVPFGTVKLEAMADQKDLSKWYGFLDFGIDMYLDATIRTDIVADSPRNATFDLGYNFISPMADTAPGISVGLLDAPNRTVDGRRIYLASTFRVVMQGYNSFVPAEITLGGTLGKKDSPFVGMMLPLRPNFRVLAEHDGYRINAGVAYIPTREMTLKYEFVGSQPRLAVQVQVKVR